MCYPTLFKESELNCVWKKEVGYLEWNLKKDKNIVALISKLLCILIIIWMNEWTQLVVYTLAT